MILKILAFGIGLLAISSIHARVHHYETTRMKSTAGAGIGSVLMDEASLLNPAALAFFNASSVYLQRSTSSYEVTSRSNKASSYENTHLGLIVSDAKSSVKGNISYFDQEENGEARKSLALSTAYALNEKSSVGFSYRFSQEKNLNDFDELAEEKINQFNVGVFHVLSPNLTFGATIYDPTKERLEDNRLVIGFQYLFNNFISLMADGGSSYNDDLSANALYRLGIQFRFLEDIYLRAGYFKDRQIEEKGSGVGIGWIAPRFVVEAALKNTTPIGQTKSTITFPTDVRETSISMSYKF